MLEKQTAPAALEADHAHGLAPVHERDAAGAAAEAADQAAVRSRNARRRVGFRNADGHTVRERFLHRRGELAVVRHVGTRLTMRHGDQLDRVALAHPEAYAIATQALGELGDERACGRREAVRGEHMRLQSRQVFEHASPYRRQRRRVGGKSIGCGHRQFRNSPDERRPVAPSCGSSR